MPRETEHCPDDEPLRITLAKAILVCSARTGRRFIVESMHALVGNVGIRLRDPSTEMELLLFVQMNFVLLFL